MYLVVEDTSVVIRIDDVANERTIIDIDENEIDKKKSTTTTRYRCSIRDVYRYVVYCAFLSTFFIFIYLFIFFGSYYGRWSSFYRLVNFYNNVVAIKRRYVRM